MCPQQSLRKSQAVICLLRPSRTGCVSKDFESLNIDKVVFTNDVPLLHWEVSCCCCCLSDATYAITSFLLLSVDFCQLLFAQRIQFSLALRYLIFPIGLTICLSRFALSVSVARLGAYVSHHLYHSFWSIPIALSMHQPNICWATHCLFSITQSIVLS